MFPPEYIRGEGGRSLRRGRPVRRTRLRGGATGHSPATSRYVATRMAPNNCTDRGHGLQVFGDMADGFACRQVNTCDLVCAEADGVVTVGPARPEDKLHVRAIPRVRPTAGPRPGHVRAATGTVEASPYRRLVPNGRAPCRERVGAYV